jgi:hypothetical protein
LRVLVRYVQWREERIVACVLLESARWWSGGGGGRKKELLWCGWYLFFA